MASSLQHIKNKLASIPLSKWFFYALILAFPFGTDKIWISQKSYYYGYLAFYNTFHLYLTDLLFFGLIIVWFTENRGHLIEKFDNIYKLLSSFWLILAISLIFSRETLLGAYGLLKITQYLLLFVYIREKLAISRERLMIFWLILATFSLQSIIAASQYFTQSSLGLRFLGEEWFRPGLKGVAEFVSREIASPILYDFFPNLSQNSDILIRGHGTLPHPNVLSGLLFLGVMVNLYLLYEYGRLKPTNTYKLLLSISLILLLTGLTATFSRITWAVAALAVLAWLIMMFVKVRKPPPAVPPHYSPKALAIVILALASAVIINLFLFGPPLKARLLDKGSAEAFAAQESVTNRTLYNEIAWRMIVRQPVLGVGPRNFVARMDDFVPTGSGPLLPYLHQPAHNIYLLIAAEGGAAALILFCVVIYNIVRHAKRDRLGYTLLITTSGLLVIGFFDHYLWTIQQGSLVFWVVLGLLAAHKKMEA